jgi:predicted acyl esterase
LDAERRRTRPLAACAAAVLCGLLAAAVPAAAKPTLTPAEFHARGSAEQVYATGVSAHGVLTLVDRHGRTVASKRADALGGVVFRGIAAGHGYRLTQHTPAGLAQSLPLTVLSDRSAPPSTRIYHQRIPTSGYGYLTTRDGTKLAIDVRLPAGPGPYATLIEYSGYGYADPAGPQNGIAQIAQLLGFAVVDVNIRGTGCSAGSYDFFEPLQNLDGYDVIETVARQPWVLHHRVGMAGISFGGFSQLFVAQTDPPDLAAIAPMSVFDSPATTLDAGGILNTGFTVGWVKDRVHDARPASPTGGQAWAFRRIRQGDATCRSNQALHGEAVDLLKRVRTNRYYVPAVADPLSPVKFVHRITVPVYLACQFTDEQTGGHCPELASRFSGTAHTWFTFTNGVHADSLDPDTFVRWYDFLKLFVARQAPHLSAATRALAPTLYEQALGVPGVSFPPDPIESEPTYPAALRAFERLSRVRVLFDNGAGGSQPGQPLPRFERSFSRFPIPGTRARSFFLGENGALSPTRPSRAAADVFTWDKRAVPATDFTGNTGAGGLWAATPHYHWAQNRPGTVLSYLSPRLESNLVVIGAGGVQLWVKSSVPDVDLQVTVSEVRRDGTETLVQDGWLRASVRKLSPQSTLLDPEPTFRRSDAASLPHGRYSELTVPLYYQGHAYRRGSRLRITVGAPAGAQPVWSFADTVPASGHATVTVAHSRRMPSRLVLPAVPGVSVPSAPPPCPGLRGEPCRSYLALANRPAGS